MTQIMLIQEFLDGATEGVSDGGHNLKIKGDKLIHFSTVIAERHKNKINYTKNARKYLEGVPIIKGINGTELVDLILKYYEDLSEKYQKMIPLEMVYIPVPLEED